MLLLNLLNYESKSFFKKIIRIRIVKLYTLIFVIILLPLLILSTPTVEDSLGTMGTAAFLARHNWSIFLAEEGYFYKYGQALWYIFPFLFLRDPILRYRIMLVVNSALMALIPLISFQIVHEDLKIDEKTSFWIALTVGLFPSSMLYSKYTWAETMLIVLPWLILRILCTIIQNEIDVKKLMWQSAILSWTAGYAFMCHQRGIVVVIATTISFFYVLFRGHIADRKLRKMAGMVYVVNLILALVLDRILTAWVKTYVYAGAVLKYNTLAGFLDPELYRKLFSPLGQQVFWTTIAGWLFHSGMATFGLALVGILTAIGFLMHARYSRGEDATWDVISLQSLLCYAGAFALGILFFFQTLYGYWNGTEVERCDHLVFGRYLESSLPVLVMLGLVSLYRGTKRQTRLLIAVWMILLALFFAWRIAPAMTGVDCYVHSLMALNLFMDSSNVTMTRDIIPNLPQALVGFSMLSVFVCGLLLLFYQKKQKLMSILVILLFLSIYAWNMVQIIYRVDAAGKTVYAQYYLTH